MNILSWRELSREIHIPAVVLRWIANQLGIYKGTHPSLKQRLESKVIRGRNSNDCWGWMGNMDGNGYSIITNNGRRMLARRASYMLYIGLIPSGTRIGLKCKNRICTNPAHLKLLVYQNQESNNDFGRIISKNKEE